MRGEGEVDGGAAVSLVLITVGVAQVLVNANAELYELLANAVELRGSASDGLNSLEDLGGRVGASRGDATLVQHVGERDLGLQLDGGREVIMLILDVGRCRAGAVLVEFVSPKSFFVIALKVGPDGLQLRDQISNVLGVELRTAVAGPSTVVVLGPETVNHPIVEALRTAVAARGSAHTSRPANSPVTPQSQNGQFRFQHSCTRSRNPPKLFRPLETSHATYRCTNMK